MSYLIALAAMAVLVLDSSTAIQGASEAVTLCIRTAIPSLFPFFVLSGMIVPHAAKLRIPWLGRLLKLPSGWESVFLLGAVSGYPVGAQCVAQGFRTGRLDKQQAARMLGFCTNCGPAFLFGIVGAAFSDHWAPLAILLIGILTAIMVGSFWPAAPSHCSDPLPAEPVSLSQAIHQAIRSMSSVCAWIILGKVILGFLNKWLLWRLPPWCGVLLSGIIELTNGCLSLPSCEDTAMRFVIACGIVPFGGICVAMQVMSLSDLPCGIYLAQKTVQGFAASLLGLLYLHIPSHPIVRLALITGLCAMIFIFTMEIRGTMVYNDTSKGGTKHAVSQKNRQILPILRLRHQAGQRTDAV